MFRIEMVSEDVQNCADEGFKFWRNGLLRGYTDGKRLEMLELLVSMKEPMKSTMLSVEC
jgi:hypothetical protein